MVYILVSERSLFCAGYCNGNDATKRMAVRIASQQVRWDPVLGNWQTVVVPPFFKSQCKFAQGDIDWRARQILDPGGATSTAAPCTAGLRPLLVRSSIVVTMPAARRYSLAGELNRAGRCSDSGRDKPSPATMIKRASAIPRPFGGYEKHLLTFEEILVSPKIRGKSLTQI